MIFIRIPSFLIKEMANLYAVNMSSIGCVSLSSAKCKEIEEQVKAMVANGKAKPIVSVEPFGVKAKEQFGCWSSKMSKTSSQALSEA